MTKFEVAFLLVFGGAITGLAIAVIIEYFIHGDGND